MPGIAVVIPFYARGPTVLAEAVRSALGQRGVPTPTVIVVDDGSQRPAVSELEVLDPGELTHVRVLRQPNGGPSSARNAGLDAVPEDIEWVALLDADDIWSPDHLTRAIYALERGYDFYFCNLRRLVDDDTHFAQCGLSPSEHPRLVGESTLHAFHGDFFSSCLTRSPVGTPTVVYRKSVLGSLRFRTFPRLWEDLMFWLEVANRTKRIVFDTTVRVECGPGGITGTDGWRSAAELRRKLCYIQHFSHLKARFRLTPEQAAIVRSTTRQHTEGFVVTALGLLKQGTLPERQIVWDFVRWRPSVIPTIALVLMRHLARQVFRRSEPRAS